MDLKETIIDTLYRVANSPDRDAKTSSAKDEIFLEFPEREEFGDYSTNVALIQAKKTGKNPRQLAEELKISLEKDDKLKEIVEKIEIAGPGFINFYLKSDVLVDNLIQIDKEKEKYGQNSLKKNIKVCVEYTDPNPFKEFHIGHLISNVTGESLARLQEACDATLWRADYFGDVGIHAAKSVWGLTKKMADDGLTLADLSKKDLQERVNYMGQGYTLGSKAYDEDEKAKEEIGKLNTVLYLAAQKMWEAEGKKSLINYNPEGKVAPAEIEAVYDLYVTGRKWSLEYFETIYKRLGTKFDGYYPESTVAETGYRYVKENIGKVFEESQEAVIFPGEKFGLHTRVFINKHNLPTYEAKELGLAPAKYHDFPYDESVIVVGKEIREYFAVLVEALTQINPKLGKVTHPIFTGMVSVTSGKMGSRFGNVITVTGLLDRLKEMAISRMKEGNYSNAEKEEISEMVAVAALKYEFLKSHTGHDLVFDFEKSLALEGDSGPYLQYTFARTCSVLAKAGAADGVAGDLSLNPQELSVLRKLNQFHDVIIAAAKSYSPNLICNYLYDLAQKYNTFYNAHRIIGEENQAFRVKLTQGVGIVIKNGLNLLGISAPARM